MLAGRPLIPFLQTNRRFRTFEHCLLLQNICQSMPAPKKRIAIAFLAKKYLHIIRQSYNLTPLQVSASTVPSSICQSREENVTKNLLVHNLAAQSSHILKIMQAPPSSALSYSARSTYGYGLLKTSTELRLNFARKEQIHIRESAHLSPFYSTSCFATTASEFERNRAHMKLSWHGC